MTFHLFVLLSILMLSLAWLCCLSLLHKGLAHWRTDAVHPLVHRLRHRPARHVIVQSVACPPHSQRVQVHHL